MCFLQQPETQVAQAPSVEPQKTDADLARDAENLRSNRRQSERGFAANFLAPADDEDTAVRKIVLGG